MLAGRILILAPHPDDEVVGACAAIGRARREGARLHVAFLTTGVPGPERLWRWQRGRHGARVARRREEARCAAGLLGIEPVHFSETPSRRLKEHLAATRERLRGLLRELGVGLVWAPAYEGGHQDHDAASFLASTLRAQVPVWEFSEYHYRGGRVRSQQFLEPSGDERELLLAPQEAARKREALALYASERGNLGYVRCEREVLRPQRSYDYARPPHAGRLFYQRFQWVSWHPRVDSCRPEEVCRALCNFAGRLEGGGARR